MSFVDTKTDSSNASDGILSRSVESMSFVDASNLADSERSAGDSGVLLTIQDEETDGDKDMGDSSGIGSFVDAAKEFVESSAKTEKGKPKQE